MSLKKIIKIFIILSFLISGTTIPFSYARYTVKNNRNANVEVAKWDISINESSMNERISFDLFETVNNSFIKDGVKVVAPGTSGSFTFNIKNNSDVIAEYSLIINETSNSDDIPILYSLEKNGEYKDLNELIFPINEEIKIEENNNTKTITIYWKWDFYSSSIQNKKDNELAQSGTSLLELTMNIKAKQKGR